LASVKGTFKDIDNRSQFFNRISSMIPQGWRSETFEAVATSSADGQRIVIKAVNYEKNPNILLMRLQGSTIPENAEVKIYKLSADLEDTPSMENPNEIKLNESTIPYTKDLLTIEMEPYTVAVIEIKAK